MKVTAAKLKSIHGKPYDGKAEVTDGDNLSLRISPKGKIAFQMRYRINGKPARFRLGAYPEMSLAEARKKCEEQMQLVRQDLDPRNMVALSEIELPDENNPTISECIDYWFKLYCLSKRERPYEILNRVSSCINKDWMSQYISQMNKSHFSALFLSMSKEGVEKGRGAGYAFNSIIELRTVLRYCLRQGFIKNSEFEALRPGDFARDYDSREHFLSLDECRRIWKNVDHLALTDRNKVMLRCAMVFGCRISELYTAHKSDFDLDAKLFTVRRENTKGKVHSIVRPIPDILIEDLKYLKGLTPGYKHIFPNRDGDKPASSASVSRIASACYEYIDGVNEFRMHDFRRTISTHLTDAGCPLQFTEKLLGHKMKGVLAIYNKSPMLDGLTEWVNKWVVMLEADLQ
ncbi:tyrosine-type recombinase/integrase [Pseudoalteromonas sp. S16_S37]|uniref:tyrosine-type recombinase/integrase n=1 Tax=Pseudoalteromonas sp. S16_S37 TaxID=2720228 RepID=UPI001680DC9D|nr:site-specific integrase [Pseudoalteromonas sp. S16_S37]MBD1583455.1 site-specific integrase [Pseudoalteromonas sp. S16_S37]